MNRWTPAGIVLAGAIAMTVPNAARSAGPETSASPPQSSLAQAAAGDEGPAGGPGDMHWRGGRGTGPGRGEMMGMDPERREMLQRMMQRTPQERCLQRVARRAGMVAYASTMLNLTAEQRPLWDKLNDIVQQNLQKAQLLCTGLGQHADQETLLDRLDRAERFLSARLQALQQIRPLMQQLYQALSPEQKTVLDRMIRHRGERT